MNTIEQLEKYIKETKTSLERKLQHAEEQLAELKKTCIADPISGQWYIAHCGVSSCDYIIKFDKKDGDSFHSFEYGFESSTRKGDLISGGWGGNFTSIVREATAKEVESLLKQIEKTKKPFPKDKEALKEMLNIYDDYSNTITNFLRQYNDK